jgi:hypothetical protein
VREALIWAGVDVATYGLESDFLPPRDISLAEDDWLLIVVYFGLTTESVIQAAGRWPAERLIIDAAQALYFESPTGIFAILSPRKFIGVADGGYLTGDLAGLGLPDQIDDWAAWRLRAAIGRLEGEPEPHYHLFLEAERSLADINPRRMSPITESLLRRADWTMIKKTRRANFLALAERLPSWCQPALSLGPDDVPLCLPIRTDSADSLREFLARQRIYTQAYWKELDMRELNAFERSLCTEMLCLPCDQRYGEAEMNHVADLLHGLPRDAQLQST